MPRRRVEVVVDLTLGDINVPSSPVSIPATISGGGGGGGGGTGGGGGGTGGGGGAGGSTSSQATILAVLGPNMGRTVIATLQRINVLLRAIGPSVAAALPYAIPIIAAFAASLASVYLQVAATVWILRQLAGVFKGVFLAAVRVGSSLLREFAETVAELAVTSLREMIEAAEAAAVAVYNLTRDVLQSATSYFADFEQAIASTVAVMGQFGDTADTMRQKVADMANTMSETSRFSGLQLAQAMQEVAKAGYEDAGALEAVTNAGRILAEATLEDVTASTELLIKTLHQFGFESDQAMRTINVLAAAANKSLASVESLGKALEYAGPTAHLFNMSLEETTAVIMAMFQQGARGSMAGTQLTNMFNALTKQSRRAREEFAAFGFDLTQLDPTKVGMIEVIEQFEKLAQRIGMANTISLIWRSFEVRAARGFSMALVEGSAKLRQYQREITGTNDALKMQQDQMRTLQGAWLMLQNVWKTALVAIMRGGVQQAFGSFVGYLRDMVKWLKEAGVLGNLGAGIAGIIKPLAEGVKSIGPAAARAFQQIVAVLPQVGKALAGALGTAAPLLEGFVKFLGDLGVKVITEFIPALLQLAVAVLPKLIALAQAGLPLVVNILTSLANVLTQLVTSSGDQIVQLLLNWGKAILQVVKALPDLLPLVSQLLSMLVGLPKQMADFVTNMLPVMVNLVQNAVLWTVYLVAQFRMLAEDIVPKLYEGFAALWNGLLKPMVAEILLMMADVFQLGAALLDMIQAFHPLILVVNASLAGLLSIAWVLEKTLQGIAWVFEKVTAFLEKIPGLKTALQMTVGDSDYWKGVKEAMQAAASMDWRAVKATMVAPEIIDEAGAAGADAARGAAGRMRQAGEGINGGFGLPPGPWGQKGGEIKVSLAVPPDWDALKTKFGEFADEQKRDHEQRMRTGGYGRKTLTPNPVY